MCVAHGKALRFTMMLGLYALWRTAARDKVEEIDISSKPLGARDEHLEYFADVWDETPLRKLICQKLGTEPLAPRNLTAIADWVRSIGSVSSF